MLFFLEKGIFLEKIKHLKTHRIWCLVFVFLIYPIITIVRGCWQRSCLNTCFVVKRTDVTAKIWFKVNIDSHYCAEQSSSPTQRLLSRPSDSNKIGIQSASAMGSPSRSASECYTNIAVCFQAIIQQFGCPHREDVGLKYIICSERHREHYKKTSFLFSLMKYKISWKGHDKWDDIYFLKYGHWDITCIWMKKRIDHHLKFPFSVRLYYLKILFPNCLNQNKHALCAR